MVGYGKRIATCAFAVACLVSLAGCGTPARTQWDAPAPKDPVLVLFTLDVSDGGRWPDGIKIVREGSDGKDAIVKSWRYKFKGDKYKDKYQYVMLCEDLSTGKYRFDELRVDVGMGIVVFDLKDDPRFHHTFSKPGVYFLGSYAYHTIMPPGRVGKMHFALETVRGPGEREAIERVLEAKELKDEYWRALLTRRLHQLGKR